MHKSLPFAELCALYAVSDVCLVSSTRDGMNLVSYEYIACQQKRNGVMILSEFAGAAQSLNGSIIVNPWDSQQVADAIFEAVTTSPEVRQENQKKLFKYIEKYSSAYWGTSFVNELCRTNTRLPPSLSNVTNATGVDINGSADFGGSGGGKQNGDNFAFVVSNNGNGMGSGTADGTSAITIRTVVVPPTVA